MVLFGRRRWALVLLWMRSIASCGRCLLVGAGRSCYFGVEGTIGIVVASVVTSAAPIAAAVTSVVPIAAAAISAAPIAVVAVAVAVAAAAAYLA